MENWQRQRFNQLNCLFQQGQKTARSHFVFDIQKILGRPCRFDERRQGIQIQDSTLPEVDWIHTSRINGKKRYILYILNMYYMLYGMYYIV